MDFLAKKQITVPQRRQRNDNDDIYNPTSSINKFSLQKTQIRKRMQYNNMVLNEEKNNSDFINLKRPREEDSEIYKFVRTFKKCRIDDFENNFDLQIDKKEVKEEVKEIKEELKNQ
jgi:hypothetical protein